MECWDGLSASGPQRFRQLDPQRGDAEAYDPRTHEDQIYRAHGGGHVRGPSLLILRNAFPVTFGPLQPYAAAARAMLAEQDPDAPVKRTAVDGRPAWRLEFSQPGLAWWTTGITPSDLECGMTVPRGFASPRTSSSPWMRPPACRCDWSGADGKGRIVGQMRLRRVVVDRPLPPDAFRLPAGEGADRLGQGDARAVSLSRRGVHDRAAASGAVICARRLFAGNDVRRSQRQRRCGRATTGAGSTCSSSPKLRRHSMGTWEGALLFQFGLRGEGLATAGHRAVQAVSGPARCSP